MIWTKTWLETRWKLLLMVLMDCGVLALLLEEGGGAEVWRQRLSGAVPLLFLANAVVLAGAGIATQIAFRPRQTLHGSMLFTLSLPISRRRLVLVRMAVGAMALAALVAAALGTLWTFSAGVREVLGGSAGVLYLVAVLSAAAVAYALSAVLATVLDELWQTYAALALVIGTTATVPATRVWAHAFGPDPAAALALPLLTSLALTAVLTALAVHLVRRRDF